MCLSCSSFTQGTSCHSTDLTCDQVTSSDCMAPTRLERRTEEENQTQGRSAASQALLERLWVLSALIINRVRFRTGFWLGFCCFVISELLLEEEEELFPLHQQLSELQVAGGSVWFWFCSGPTRSAWWAMQRCASSQPPVEEIHAEEEEEEEEDREVFQEMGGVNEEQVGPVEEASAREPEPVLVLTRRSPNGQLLVSAADISVLNSCSLFLVQPDGQPDPGPAGSSLGSGPVEDRFWSISLCSDGRPAPVEHKNGKRAEAGPGAADGGPRFSMFTWLVVMALLGVWSSVAVFYFDIVDYDRVLARAQEFRMNFSEVLQGLTKDGGRSANAESLEEVLNILAEEGSDWIYGFFTFLYDVVSPPAQRGEEEEEEEEGREASTDDVEVKGVILDLQNQERVERQRTEKERSERERLIKEREKLSQGRAEKERLEKERIQRERVSKEKAEKERIEREQLIKERERIAKQKKQLEKEKNDKEKSEKEQLDKDKAEKERLERIAKERERMAKEKSEKEKIDRATKEKEERERIARERPNWAQEKERSEKDLAVRKEREQTMKERENQERDKLEKQSRQKELMERQRLAREKALQEKMEAERLAKEKQRNATKNDMKRRDLPERKYNASKALAPAAIRRDKMKKPVSLRWKRRPRELQNQRRTVLEPRRHQPLDLRTWSLKSKLPFLCRRWTTAILFQTTRQNPDSATVSTRTSTRTRAVLSGSNQSVFVPEEEPGSIDTTGVLVEENQPEETEGESGRYQTSSKLSQEAEAEKPPKAEPEPEPQTGSTRPTESRQAADGAAEKAAEEQKDKAKKKKPKLLNKIDKSIKSEIDAAERLRKKVEETTGRHFLFLDDPRSADQTLPPPPLPQGNLDLALKAFDSLVQQHPLSPRARYGKAQVGSGKGGAAPGPVLVRNMVSSRQVQDDLADKLRSNDLLQSAINTYGEAAELPDVTSDLLRAALKRRAERQQFLGRMRGSLATLQKLVDAFPDDVGLRNDLGVAHLLLGDNKGAKKVYEEVLAVAPSNGFAKVHYGFILKAENKIAESIPYLREGLESGEPGTDDGRFYFHLGDALQRVGDDSAYQWYERGHQRGHFASVWQRSLYNVEGLKAQPWWTPQETGYVDLVRVRCRDDAYWTARGRF
ncbi:hypothetical protein CCH79_00019313 [Gambusia affinis]|uniref:Aspartyl beta-hydroxylase/Triadin domain-containing protein n=1 Tax=Gambusia affinis TaxID=33528 RepID=A0A315WAP3_GAMAF|nr:hypothetical protein CCH79_00019313 [Gambusia affinis]